MNIVLYKLDSLDGLNKYSAVVPLLADLSVSVFCKRQLRSDNVIIDIFLNNINNEDKIVTGKVLAPNSRIFTPSDDSFNYRIECVDIDGVNKNITPDNLHKFYLQFTNYTVGDDWE